MATTGGEVFLRWLGNKIGLPVQTYGQQREQAARRMQDSLGSFFAERNQLPVTTRTMAPPASRAEEEGELPGRSITTTTTPPPPEPESMWKKQARDTYGVANKLMESGGVDQAGRLYSSILQGMSPTSGSRERIGMAEAGLDERRKGRQDTNYWRGMNYKLAVNNFNENVRQHGERMAIQMRNADLAALQAGVDAEMDELKKQRLRAEIANLDREARMFHEQGAAMEAERAENDRLASIGEMYTGERSIDAGRQVVQRGQENTQFIMDNASVFTDMMDTTEQIGDWLAPDSEEGKALIDYLKGGVILEFGGIPDLGEDINMVNTEQMLDTISHILGQGDPGRMGSLMNVKQTLTRITIPNLKKIFGARPTDFEQKALMRSMSMLFSGTLKTDKAIRDELANMGDLMYNSMANNMVGVETDPMFQAITGQSPQQHINPFFRNAYRRYISMYNVVNRNYGNSMKDMLLSGPRR